MELRTVSVDLITPHEKLRKLALLRPSAKEIDLMRMAGITKTITVRPLINTNPQRYQLLGGVSSWVAAPTVGVHEVPVIVLEEIDDETAEDVVAQIQEVIVSQNSIKKARAIQGMLDSNPGLSQNQLALTVGEKNYNLSHYLRLLKLPTDIQDMVENNQLHYGHARAILSLESSQGQLSLALVTVKRNLSVRVVEKAARKMLVEGLAVSEAVGEALIEQKEHSTKSPPKTGERGLKKAQIEDKPAPIEKDPDIIKVEERLSGVLGTAVDLQFMSDGSGVMKISYSNLEILEGVIERIEGQMKNDW